MKCSAVLREDIHGSANGTAEMLLLFVWTGKDVWVGMQLVMYTWVRASGKKG
jgi:hypothetical protein